jgi:hypothetical protein
MRKNFKIMLIGLLALICVASVGAYALMTPQYKTLEVNGYQLEVPDSNANVTSVNDNYKTYDDKEHNVTIKSYAINNINETNYTGSAEVGAQMGTNVGQNTTIENKTVMNKSGKYTYYDLSTYQNIVITSDNYDTMAHILRTLNKIDITPNTENLTVNLTSLNATNDTNNTTTTSTQKTQSMTKKSTSKSKTSSSSSSSSKPKDTVNGGAKDLGGDYYQTADGEVHYGYKMYDHPGDSRYYHPYYS